MYHEFKDLIQEKRAKAARFYKTDLHVHSYDSPCFPSIGDKDNCVDTLTDRDCGAEPEYFAEAAKAKGLSLIAITDHNMSRVAEEISGLSDDELVVLPGMEVTVQCTMFDDSIIHILTLFPERSLSVNIDRIFRPDCGMDPVGDRNDNSRVTIPVDQFIRTVHQNGGICIASHVNSDKGARTLFRGSNVKRLRTELRYRELQKKRAKGDLTEKEAALLAELEARLDGLEDKVQNDYLRFLAEYKLDAIEVQRPTDRDHYRGSHVDELGIRPFACILASDAHNLSDIGLAGHITYIKMAQPGWKDLRKALRDPGTRIRYETDVPRERVKRIMGVQFEGGFFDGQVIGFSDNLTCLIGGRGTGKSATIDAFRYVFEHPIDHLLPKMQEDITGRWKHTLTGAEVKVLFEDTAGTPFVLKRRFDERETSCFDLNGSQHDEIDLATSANIKAEIYGWGEIEALARSTREQLNLLDKFIPEIEPLKHELQSKIGEFRRNTEDIVKLAKDILELLPRVADLPEKEGELERLSTPELNTIFAEFDLNENAQMNLRTLRDTIASIKQNFMDDKAKYGIEEQISEDLNVAKETLEKFTWFADFSRELKQGIAKAAKLYTQLIAQLDAMLALIDAKLELLADERVTIEERLNQVAEESGQGDFKTALARRKELTQKVSELREIQRQIGEKQTDIQSLLTERRDDLLPQLQTLRRRIFDMRQAKAHEINEELERLESTVQITVELEFLQDLDSFKEALGVRRGPEGLLKHSTKQYMADDYAGLYAARHDPHSFVYAVLDKAYDELRAEKVEDGTAREVISAEKAERVGQHLCPILANYEDEGYYDPDKLQRLLKLELLDVEDLPRISMDGRPIEGLSPGQRCSALIPIILLESSNPLIIDQPEDNLDNKLVFELVVDILRGLKERRQIIVATHNPNITVSGDAEQIVVFESESRERCEVTHQGSIDDDEIVEQVKAIMEGSEEAFRIRAEKYGYTLAEE